MKTAELIECGLRAVLRTTGLLMPPLGGRLAVRVFGSPVRRRWSAGARTFLQSAARRDVDWGGGRVVTHAVGGGPSILLAHGWSAHGASLRAFAHAIAERGFRAVVVDLPGHGASPGRYTNIVRCAEVLGAVAADDGDVVGAAGHSFGGTALLLALDQGRLPGLRRLATIGTPVDMDKVIRDFCRRLAVPARAERAMRRRIDTLFGAPFTDFDFSAVAPRAGVDHLVCHDRTDEAVPFSEALRLVGERGVLHETDGLGHNRVLRDAGVVGRVCGFVGEGSDRSDSEVCGGGSARSPQVQSPRREPSRSQAGR